MKIHNGPILAALLVSVLSFSCDAGGGGSEAIINITVDATRRPNADTGQPEFFAEASIINDEVEWNRTYADVTVNGEALTGEFGDKSGLLSAVPESGDQVEISVLYQGMTITERLTLPDPVASITAPQDGDQVPLSDSLTVRWNTAALTNPPDYVSVQLGDDSGGQTVMHRAYSSGSATFYGLGGQFAAGDTAVISVKTYDEADISGDGIKQTSAFRLLNSTRIVITFID